AFFRRMQQTSMLRLLVELFVQRLGLIVQRTRGIVREFADLAVLLVLLQHQFAVLVPAGTIGRTDRRSLLGAGFLHHHPGASILIGVISAGVVALVALVHQLANELNAVFVGEHLPAARSLIVGRGVFHHLAAT